LLERNKIQKVPAERKRPLSQGLFQIIAALQGFSMPSEAVFLYVQIHPSGERFCLTKETCIDILCNICRHKRPPFCPETRRFHAQQFKIFAREARAEKETQNMGKIIFLDMDGTLIDYEAKLPASAAQAVNEARANGHRVYVCTGASKAEVSRRNLCEMDGMIGGNGAYVEDHGHVVMHQGLSKADVKHIVDWCNQRHLGFYLESNSGLYCNQDFLEQGPAVVEQYAKGKGAGPAKAQKTAQNMIGGVILLHGEALYREDINKVSFILSTYQDHLDSKVEFPNLVANTWGGREELALFGDLGPANITKRHAIEMLLNYLGAEQKDTIAFGDAKIDLSMFECCAFNVAMGNGGPEIKAAADYVTTDVNDDGLYHAFQHLHLI